MKRLCRATGRQFEVSPQEERTLKRFGLPLPDVSPDERRRTRLAFHNERRFFWRTCDATKSRLYSIYPPATTFPVYAPEVWWSDSWSALDYAQGYDERRPFFVQLEELWRKVPRPAASVFEITHSRAVHSAYDVRHSFLVSSAARAQRCYYCIQLRDCTSCCDCDFVSNCAQCYECLDCHGSSSLCFSEHCVFCSDSAFLSSCRDCHHCLFCSNLEGKRFCVLNAQLSEEEYRQTLLDWPLTARPVLEAAKERFAEFLRDKPQPHLYSDWGEATTSLSGNYLYGSRDLEECFYCYDSAELLYCDRLVRAKNCYDGLGFGENLENCAQFVAVGGGAKNVINSVECARNVSDLTYCGWCENSSHLFGCVGLRNAEYCVFNTQLTRGSYQALVGDIEAQLRKRKTWGKFLPGAFSPFPYNLSTANEYMPLNKVQAAVLELPWDEEEDTLRPSQLLDGSLAPEERFGEVPERLEDLDRSRLRQLVFLCEITGRPFQLLPEEVELYERFGVCPPARSFEQRHRERRTRLGSLRLAKRECALSKQEIASSFPADWRQPLYERSAWERSLK